MIQLDYPLDVNLETRLSKITELGRGTSDLVRQYYAPQGSRLTDVEWYSIAACKRVASQVHAFCLLVQAKNTLSATAMIRLQLDTAMRIFGLSLVADVEDAGVRLMSGKQYNQLTSADGKTKLRDAVLHKELSKQYPWVSSSYEDGSAYVHLTGKHIGRVVSTGKMLFFHVEGIDKSEDEDRQILFLADTFYAATRLAKEQIERFMLTRPSYETRSLELRRLRGWVDE